MRGRPAVGKNRPQCLDAGMARANKSQQLSLLTFFRRLIFFLTTKKKGEGVVFVLPLRSFILTVFVFKTPINVDPDAYRRGSIVIVTKYVATINYQESHSTLTHDPPWGRLSNALSSVGADMYLDSFSTTTPAARDCTETFRVLIAWSGERPFKYKKNVQEETSLWDNLLRSCSFPVSRLCRPAGIEIQLGVHTCVWTAANYNLWELKKM